MHTAKAKLVVYFAFHHELAACHMIRQLSCYSASTAKLLELVPGTACHTGYSPSHGMELRTDGCVRNNNTATTLLESDRTSAPVLEHLRKYQLK